MAKTKKEKWYAVKSVDGVEVNKVYMTWGDCQKVVLHHVAVYKSFLSENQADSYLDAMTKQKQADYVQQIEYCVEKKKRLKQLQRQFMLVCQMHCIRCLKIKLRVCTIMNQMLLSTLCGIGVIGESSVDMVYMYLIYIQ